MNQPSTENLTRQLELLVSPAPAGLMESVLTTTRTGRFFDVVRGPIGDLVIGWNSSGIYAAAPVGEHTAFLEEHAVAGIPPIEHALPAPLAKKVEKALATGKLGSLPVDLSRLTEFQRLVLLKTAEIPAGQLRPYGWVAREIGKPRATRAVGSALNRNPVPVLIPCHRVGRSDGTVGQYAHGPEMKRALLRFEGADPDAVDEIAARGVRYIGSVTTNIYCHPTCHNARRIKETNRVELRDASAARRAGLRACRVCRPLAAA